MRITKTVEIAVGAFVSLGFLALFFLVMKVGNVGAASSSATYTVHAYFENVGGLRAKAPVSISGVNIGRVSSVEYDPKRFQAKVVLSIYAQHDYLPIDTQASIFTAGLLGEQYITLAPGAEEETLKDGDAILHTQSAFVLEEIIGQLLVNSASKE